MRGSIIQRLVARSSFAACALLVFPSILSGQPPADEAALARLPGEAILRTDPEYERLLERAEKYAAENRPDLAATLYQKILSEAGQTLLVEKRQDSLGPSSTPLTIYRPLSQFVQQSLAKQPSNVLNAYRTTADAEARALLSADGRNEQALAEVVRRFFLSSVGDDAAWTLASIALDQRDFVRALALLKPIATLHPDPSVPPAELYKRLVVAAAGTLDWATAEQSLAALKASADTNGSAADVQPIESFYLNLKSHAARASAKEVRGWSMRFGEAERTGVMPALPPEATRGDLAEHASAEWTVPIPGLGSLDATPAASETTVAGAAASASRQSAVQAARASLIEQWRSGVWRPAGELRFDAHRLYFKTSDRLVCYDKRSLSAEPVWQSGWQNRYELDALTQRHALLASQFGNLPRPPKPPPASLAEILLFGDRVHQSLAMSHDLIFSIEGKRATTARPPARQQPAPWATTPRRSRSNWLTAYESTGGKAQWTRTASVDSTSESAEMGFLAAPTPCGDELLVPVTRGGTIWLYGLEPETGRTRWTLLLCDEPTGGAPPWAEMVLAVSGREAYLTCGCGVAFSIDTVARTIRWAAAYQRDGKVSNALRSSLGEAGAMVEWLGWTDDVVIPHREFVLVMPSDSDRILALDRRTGERIWESPRTSPLGSVATDCLGVHNGSLYVAGPQVIRRYDVPTGRLLEERVTERSFGRGCLTADAIYLPAASAILKYNLSLDGPPQRSLVVVDKDEPLGNLFSDGERLWVLGAARVYGLMRLEDRIAQLNERVAAGDAAAQFDRMRLYLKQGRVDAALADLRQASDRLQTQLSADQAAQRLFEVLAEQRLPQEHPTVVLTLIAAHFVPTPPRGISKETQQRLADTLASCIAALRQRAGPETVGSLIAAAPLFAEDYLVTAATFSLDAIATPSDVPLLLETLQQGTPIARLICIKAAAHLAPASMREPLGQLLRFNDDRVRLAAVRALANLGERRQILETLVSLLESPLAAVRSRSHQTLQALTGQRIPFAAEGSVVDRSAGVRAWRAWLQSSGSTARLQLPLQEKSLARGHTLVVVPGALIELDADRKERWRAKLAGAGWGCEGLPDGHRLVAINSHSSVVEYDEAGREIWKKDRLPAPPTSVQRLPSGSTLIACGNAQQIVEVTPDGAVARTTVPGNPIWAQRLESGNTLVALQQPIQRVVEVDGGGRIVWEARTGGDSPWHAVRLENGNTLVTLSQSRKVVEFDPTGKSIVWSTQVSLINPLAAQRLATGTTMVVDQLGLKEIDASGKEIVWQLRLPGATGVSCF